MYIYPTKINHSLIKVKHIPSPFFSCDGYGSVSCSCEHICHRDTVTCPNFPSVFVFTIYLLFQTHASAIPGWFLSLFTNNIDFLVESSWIDILLPANFFLAIIPFIFSSLPLKRTIIGFGPFLVLGRRWATSISAELTSSIFTAHIFYFHRYVRKYIYYKQDDVRLAIAHQIKSRRAI